VRVLGESNHAIPGPRIAPVGGRGIFTEQGVSDFGSNLRSSPLGPQSGDRQLSEVAAEGKLWGEPATPGPISLPSGNFTPTINHLI
jgi:hypothetical protein